MDLPLYDVKTLPVLKEPNPFENESIVCLLDELKDPPY